MEEIDRLAPLLDEAAGRFVFLPAARAATAGHHVVHVLPPPIQLLDGSTSAAQ